MNWSAVNETSGGSKRIKPARAARLIREDSSGAAFHLGAVIVFSRRVRLTSRTAPSRGASVTKLLLAKQNELS